MTLVFASIISPTTVVILITSAYHKYTYSGDIS